MAPRAKGQAPAQYQQPSRKGKKAWRKNVDVTPVQSGLEQVRDELIQGGVIAEKPSADLFVVDPTGSAAIQQRVARLSKPLKADQIIAARSAVPAVSSRVVKANGVTDGVIEPQSKKARTKVSRAVIERLRARAYGGEAAPKDVVKSGGTAVHDPWAPSVEIVDPTASFLEKPVVPKPPSTLQEAPVSLLQNGKAMPAVPKPRAGSSYNPTFDDWDALITKAGAEAVTAEEQRLADLKRQEELEARIAAAQQEEDWGSAEESGWEGFETEAEDQEDHQSTKLPRRKTPAERNRVKRRKNREGQERHQTAMKARGEREAQRKAELSEADGQAVVPMEEHSDTDEAEDDVIHDRVLRRQQMGPDRIPEASLDIPLPDELQDSLRRMKPEGNALRDRFHNLLVRGRMETRRARDKKQGRKMTKEKWSYKDFEVPGAA